MRWLLVAGIVFSALMASDFSRDDKIEVVLDAKASLMWQDDYDVMRLKLSYDKAKEYCSALEFAGYNDWFLPSVSQMKSILRPENYPRAIEKTFIHVAKDYYWSATQYSDNTAYILLYTREDVAYYSKENENYVRCVRQVKQ